MAYYSPGIEGLPGARILTWSFWKSLADFSNKAFFFSGMKTTPVIPFASSSNRHYYMLYQYNDYVTDDK